MQQQLVSEGELEAIKKTLSVVSKIASAEDLFPLCHAANESTNRADLIRELTVKKYTLAVLDVDISILSYVVNLCDMLVSDMSNDMFDKSEAAQESCDDGCGQPSNLHRELESEAQGGTPNCQQQ